MKIVRLVVVLAVALSICFCGIYLKFFSTINSYINTYIVQVGIYKQDEPKYLEYLKSKGFLYLGHRYLYGGLKYAGNI